LKKLIKKFGRTDSILTGILLFIIFWIVVLLLFVSYVIRSTDKNWESIQTERIAKEKSAAEKYFNSYQNSLNEICEKTVKNLDFRSSVENNNNRKVFEFIAKTISQNDVVVEIYDAKLNPISFYGRQLESDNFSLSRALASEKFSVIKDIGFYTYLIINSPLKSVNDENKIIGVCGIAKLIDVKNQPINKYYPDFGLTSDIQKSTGAEVILYATELLNGLNGDNNLWKDKIFIDLNGLHGAAIGRIQFPDFDRQLYVQEINSSLDKFISVLVFAAGILLIILFIRNAGRFKDKKYSLIKVVLFGVLLIVIRFLFLQLKFPSALISSDVFTSQYYSQMLFSAFYKSLGELLVTAIFILGLIFYIAKVYSERDFIYKTDLKTTSKSRVILNAFRVIFLLALYNLFFEIFGELINSIIDNSDIKFFDKSSFLPNPELLILEIVFLIITFTFLFLNSSLTLIYFNRIKNSLQSERLKRYAAPIFIVLSVLSLFIADIFFCFRISIVLRLIILILILSFTLYINFYSLKKKSFGIYSLRNFAVIILLAVPLTPALMLENLKSQEKSNLEKLGKSITGEQEERATFILSNELLNLTTNRNLESIINDKSKLNKSAFLIWKESKLSSENFNSAVIIIDSAKRILSDFNITPNELETDSIVNFVSKKFINKILKYTGGYNNPDTLDISIDSVDTDLEYFPVAFENINIFKNLTDKYYVGISVIENKQYRNTRNHHIMGYLIIVIQSDVKNILYSNTQRLFKSKRKENYFNKIISEPVITEFLNNEIENSSDMELARELVSTIPYIREKLKANPDKGIWQTESINDGSYNSLFLRAEYKKNDNPGGNIQRVIVISVNNNDFGLIFFYYIKILIYLLVLYFILYIILIGIFSFRIRTIRLSFRNKLFITFLVVSIIPITLLGVYTRTYLIKKNDIQMQNQIKSDLNFVTDVMRSEKSPKKSSAGMITVDSTGKYYSDLLKKYFSKTDKNINIFVKGRLVATTNDELYKSDLLDTRIDADGYYNLTYLKNDQYIKAQNIGRLSFLEGFKPIIDNSGKISAIVSSLSVYRQKELDEELTETITYIFGTYILVILLLLLLVSYFTGRISKPVLMLKEATDKLSEGEDDVILKINRSDELGTLVESFNKMTKELRRSKEILKRAEREAAWRDIARRVAHEIKNPLTPMKLSIQYLVSVYKKNSDDAEFEKILNKTKELISNEIDKLNRISSEFSDFAKLPGRNYIYLQVNNVIDEVIALYLHQPGIRFEKEFSDNLPDIKADRHELNRAFQNLIKNSIQSIESEGTITIKTYMKDSAIFVQISDNGCGMDKEVLSKLFEPNFSTKSSGMGLGLAITKKTLDDMQADISFKSEVGKGTQVTIKFKINETEKYS
jgi:signal transduction histidine kinase